jgi:uncharacterized membrane protein
VPLRMPSPSPRRGWWSPLTPVIFLYLAFVFGTIQRHDLWCDEIYTLRAAELDMRELVTQRANQGHPPLFFLLEKFVRTFAGNSEMPLRFLPAMFGLGSVVIVYRLVIQHYERRIAALSSLVFAFTPAQLFICQTARSYSLVQLWLLLFLYVIARSDKITRAKLTVGSIVCAAAMYTHNQTVLWVPVFLYSALLVWPRRWTVVLAGFLGYLTYVPFALAFSQVDKLTFKAVSSDGVSLLQWLQLPGRIVFGVHSQDVSLSILLTGTFLVVRPYWGLVSMQTGRDKKQLLHFFGLALFAGAVIALASAATGTNIVTVERYFAPLFPATAFAAAWWLQSLRNLTAPIRYVAGITILISCLSGVALYWKLPPFLEPRSIAEFLVHHRQWNEPVILYGYYPHRIPMMFYYPQNSASIAETDRLNLRRYAKDSDRLWIVLCTPSAELVENVNIATREIDGRIQRTYPFRRQQLIEIVTADRS